MKTVFSTKFKALFDMISHILIKHILTLRFGMLISYSTRDTNHNRLRKSTFDEMNMADTTDAILEATTCVDQRQNKQCSLHEVHTEINMAAAFSRMN